MKQKIHVPVMLNEILDYLKLAAGKTIVDATIGLGGHSQRIFERIVPGGRVIGIDLDEESLKIAQENLKKTSLEFKLIKGNFKNLDQLLEKEGIEKVDGILFDLGISSFQLDDPQRGFSFQYDGPLDMRLDKSSYISAYDLVNNLNEEEISSLLWQFGQERWHNRIARILVQERQKNPISTTLQLSDIISKAIPYKYRHYKIHPATRSFQAMRIAVNRELETLEGALEKAVQLLNKGGRICVISFHSLEDRIVKLSLRKFSASGLIEIITPKPLTPTRVEVEENPSSRSAKLRVAERK